MKGDIDGVPENLSQDLPTTSIETGWSSCDVLLG
jgi:hypothetical protein